MKKIKLYIFHPYSNVGGADLSISRLINNLDNKKYDITFICLNKPGIIRYLKKKIKIITIKKNRTFFSFFELRNIIWQNYDLDKEYKKVIFISNQNYANILTICSLRSFNHLKIILVERNNPIELDFSKSIKSKLVKFLIRFTYKYADKIISISRDLGFDLEKICHKKIHSIYNPSFDPKLYKYKERKKNKKKIVLCVARFEKQKNHEMLLKAFKLSLGHINSHLILFGYGSEKKNIKEIIKKNKLEENVKIISGEKNPIVLYKKADLFVLTSLYEGFGNVLVEAGAFKIPIISTNCKSGPREILNNGKLGDLVKINDYKKLSNLIVKNLNYPDKLKISKMYKSLNRFNINTHVDKYEKIFKTI